MKNITSAITATLGFKIIDMELRYKALEELLIEKEVASEQEIEEKYKQVFSRDIEKLNEELMERIAEAVEKNNKTRI